MGCDVRDCINSTLNVRTVPEYRGVHVSCVCEQREGIRDVYRSWGARQTEAPCTRVVMWETDPLWHTSTVTSAECPQIVIYSPSSQWDSVPKEEMPYPSFLEDRSWGHSKSHGDCPGSPTGHKEVVSHTLLTSSHTPGL